MEVPYWSPTYNTLLTLESPQLVLEQAFLTDRECQYLITNFDNLVTASQSLTPGRRTSKGCFIDIDHDAVLATIAGRLEERTGWSSIHLEAFNFIRYDPGDEYKPHQDAFPTTPDSLAGQRVASVIMYLNDAPLANSTWFPQRRLCVYPRQGQCLFFHYPNADRDPLTLHAGGRCTTTKYLLVAWFREGNCL